MDQVKATFKNVWAHAPIYVGIVLVIANALIDSGYVHLSDPTTTFINAVLAALGLGVLHVRQQAQVK